jgi:hypothetical protein
MSIFYDPLRDCNNRLHELLNRSNHLKHKKSHVLHGKYASIKPSIDHIFFHTSLFSL